MKKLNRGSCVNKVVSGNPIYDRADIKLWVADRNAENFSKAVWLTLLKMQKSHTVFLSLILVCGTFAFCPTHTRQVNNFNYFYQ